MERRNEDVLLDARTGRGKGLGDATTSRLLSLVSDAPGVAASLLRGDVAERPDAHLVIRSLSAILAKALREHDGELLHAGLRSYAATWEIGDADAMLPTRTPDFEASLWEGLAVELYALGALATSLERWADMRSIVEGRPVSKHDDSWLRQGQVASSRASSERDESILDVALRRYVELDPNPPTDGALASLCQFDLLSALIMSETDPDMFFPNCAQFSEALVEPLVIGSLRHPNSPLREHVFADDPARLREALRDFDAKARTQAAYQRRAGSEWEWRAFNDARTWAFINEGHFPEEWGG